MSTSRQRIETLVTDLSEVLAWGEAAEAANETLRELNASLAAERDTAVADAAAANAIIAMRDAAIAAKDAEIAAIAQAAEEELTQQLAETARYVDLWQTEKAEVTRLNEELALATDEIARLNALLNPPPAFILGDATRKQFLGAPFTEPFPICYESAFYSSGVDRTVTPISADFVLSNTMPNWRTFYPNAPRWIADIEWANSGGRTAAEVAKIVPAFEAARSFAEHEGKGLKIGGYDFPRRFGTHMSDDEVMAQAAIDKPILDLLDECILTLYPIYTDIERSRTYIRRNIEMGRRIMPGKPVYVLLAPGWHPTVGAPLANTPISVEWWRMAMDECARPETGADGFAIWLKANAPQPTDEPWWLESLDWSGAL